MNSIQTLKVNITPKLQHNKPQICISRLDYRLALSSYPINNAIGMYDSFHRGFIPPDWTILSAHKM